MLGTGELVLLVGVCGILLLVLLAVFFFLQRRDGSRQD